MAAKHGSFDVRRTVCFPEMCEDFAMQSKPNTSATRSASNSFRSLQHAATEIDLLDERLCDKFAAWIIPELDRLRETYADFVTPNSGRSLR